MKQIAFWVIAVAIYTMIGMPAAWANDGRLFTVSSESWETVHTEGLGALTGDQNVYALLTNSNCGQLGFRTLLQTRREALAVATDLSRQLQRQMFVYEVRSTENMYSLAASVAHNIDQISPELDNMVIRLGALDDRWITPNAIAPGDIVASFDVDRLRIMAGFPTVIHRPNENYVPRAPVIYEGFFRMAAQPQVISNNYVRLARLEHGGRLIDACIVAAFRCDSGSSSGARLFAAQNHCIATADIEKISIRQAFARRIYPALMEIF